MVYVVGYTELKGSIHGSLISSRLLLRTAAATYENHLLNAEIDLSKLPKDFVGSAVLASMPTQRMIKWLE